MPNINIKVAGKIATNMSPGVVIVCGNSDYTVTFTFDDEWTALSLKTARFTYIKGGRLTYEEVPFVGNEVAVPVMSDITDVFVGAYAGDLHTTTPARVLTKRSTLCGLGPHKDPAEDIYLQLISLLNTMGGIPGPAGPAGIHIGSEPPTDSGIQAWIDPGGNAPPDTTPHIGGNGNWYLGATDTGVKAEGYTPAKGVDYWTEVDKQEINNESHTFIVEELAKRGQVKPEFANSVEECTDTTKLYVLPDGYIYSYRKVEKQEPAKPLFTNVLPQATDASGNPYNGGKGYKEDYRVSSSNVEKAASGYDCTGYIPAATGDIIRIKNVDAFSDSNNLCTIAPLTTANQVIRILYGSSYTADSEGVYTIDTTALAGMAKFRLTAIGITADTIITVNEEIKYSSAATVTGYQWANSGHAFVPADYEDRIAGLEATSAEQTNDIAKIKSAVMYISPNGNDSNDGLTVNTPKKTVKACVKAGATRISAKRGVYNEIVQLWHAGELEIFPTDNDKTYTAGEDRTPIIFDASDQIAASDLTVYNSIKRVAYSNAANTQFDKVFIKKTQTPLYGGDYGSRYSATIWLLSEDEKTVCIKLKPVLTVAECEAELNTFSFVDGYIYINADVSSVSKVAVPTNWDCGLYFNGLSKVVLKEVEVRFSGSYNIDLRNCTFFDLYKCACKYTSYGSGFHPYNSNGCMTACYATKNYDGYGISGHGHTTYIDCVSEYNFDDGASHHNATTGTFIGGRYEGNGTGGNAPSYGATVNIYGGLYKDNGSFGIGYLSTASEPASGTVQGAVMIGNQTGLYVQKRCTVDAVDCIYKDNDIDKSVLGTLNEYAGAVNGEASSPTSGYTNLLPQATDASGNPYNGGKGYKEDYRVSSSNVEKAASGYDCTGYIPCSANSVIRIKNIATMTDNSRYCTILPMTASNAVIKLLYGDQYAPDSNGVWTIDLSGISAPAKFRLTAKGITSDTIITVNEEIVDTERERIEELEKTVATHTAQIEKMSSGIDADETAAIRRIKDWKFPIHEDAPVFLLDSNKPAITTDQQNTDAVYAKYDALMADHAEFVTKENMGMASDGSTPIYVYHFAEPTPHHAPGTWSESKPVILICSGVHPTEQAGVWSLYYALEEITTNKKLLDLRRNLHLVVMPMINPTGITDSTYGVRNPDGIQTHYNFEVDFRYPGTSGYVAAGNRNYGGETPLSIPETQYFDTLMQKYKDTLALVLSCHNNDYDEQYGTGFIWCSCATHFMCNLGFRFVDKMSAAWHEKYGTAFEEGIRWANEWALGQKAAGSAAFANAVEQPEWDYRVGRASISGSGGTEYKQGLKYGVHGINVEVCDRCLVLDKDASKKRTANVTTMGAETYINFFRTYMAAYDPKNKKDYAPNLPWGK